MDVSPYLQPLPAPRAIFDALEVRRGHVRYRVPEAGGWRDVTWEAHAAEVRAVACWLASVGLGAEERAAIFAPSSVAWMAAALGIQAAGGAMVPVYPSSTAEQLGYVVEHADARVLFVDAAPLLAAVYEAWPRLGAVEHVVLLGGGLDVGAAAAAARARSPEAPSAEEAQARTRTWDEVLAAGAAADRAAPGAFEARLHGIALDAVGLMLYTSGTSGPPKGVPLTHGNVAANGSDWLRCNGPLVDEGLVDLLWLPLSHIFGFGEACLGNALGWTSWLVSPLEVLARLPEVRPHVLMSVPSTWEKLAVAALEAGEGDARRARLREVTGGRLRFCLSGGAGLKREVKELFHDAGLLIVEGYGLTEASPTLTLNRPDAFRFDSVGRALPSVELRLAEDGEIEARGPNVFRGYHKDPEATRAAFTEDGWLRTGDLGRLTEDGFLQIVGRKKEILVTAGGKNVAPANLEQRFADDPYVAQAVVYGDGKRYLVAGLWLDRAAVAAWLDAQGVAEEDRAAAVERLVAERVAAVNATLPRHETLKRWRVLEPPLTVEGGFLTPTLKLRRKQVEEAFGPLLEELYR